MPHTTQLNIMLADDHILLRDALATLINGFDGFRVCAVAADGAELVQAIKAGVRADIVLLDLNMPHMDGFKTTEWLSHHHPDVKVLILSMFDSEIAMIRLLQHGVRGFLKKDIHPTDLKEALHAVMDHGYYYTGNTTNRLAALFRKEGGSASRLERAMLNESEILFLQLASSDRTYKEIATEMKVTTRVVDNYRESLFEKLDVRSRVGLVMYAIKHGVVGI